MGKNNIKLKISGSVHCVSSFITCKSPKVFPERNIFFFTKFKMAAKRHVEVVIHKLFDIYFNVIPHFHMIFNAEFISEASSNFEGFVKE